MLALCAAPGLNHTYCVLWGRVLRLKCFEDFLALFSGSENRGIWTYSRMRICWDVYWSCGFGKLRHYSSACLGVCFRLLMTALAHLTINDSSPPYLPTSTRIMWAQARFASSYRRIFSSTLVAFLAKPRPCQAIPAPRAKYAPCPNRASTGFARPAPQPIPAERAQPAPPRPAPFKPSSASPRLPDVAITRASYAAPCPGPPA